MGSLAREILRVVDVSGWEGEPLPYSWGERLKMKGNSPNVFDIPTDGRAFVISKRGRIPDMIICAESVVVPTFEIATMNGPDAEVMLDKCETVEVLSILRGGLPSHHLGVEDVSEIPSVASACVAHVGGHVGG